MLSLFGSPQNNKSKSPDDVEDPSALEDSISITNEDGLMRHAADLNNSNSHNHASSDNVPSSSVFRRPAAVTATAPSSWDRRTSAPLHHSGVQEGHNSFSHTQDYQNQAPRRVYSLNETQDDHNHNRHSNNYHDNAQSNFHDYSDRGLGARPLGFQAVARVRKLEKKERSSRRFLLKHQLSTSSIHNEQTPLKRTSHTSAATSVSSDGHHHSTSADPNDDQTLDPDPETTVQVLKNIIFGKTVSVLLLFMPVALWAHYGEWSAVWIFWLNFAVMVPLATILSDFTEEVAAHTNQTLGGLINATFGNAVEVLVGIQALLANEIRVVQASMLGSIFSNLLLVLGSCFFFGGLYYKEQRFNSTAATANMGLLALSSIALVLPTPFAEYYKVQDEHVLTISRVAAIFLMFMYFQLLVFQLKTHAHLFQDDADGDSASIPLWVAISGLLITTLTITLFSEALVQSIDGFCQSSGISRTFVGLIILPFVGNAVEHVAAVTVAMKDKMDLAMGVAVGSCTQISLFVTPLTVLVGWGLNKDMTLNFPHFEIILYVMSVVTVSICLSNPKGNWLEGSLLITTYLMIASGFWFEKVVDF